MTTALFRELEVRNQSPSIKLPLLATLGGTLLFTLVFWLWSDHTNTELAKENYAAAQDFLAVEDYEHALQKLDFAIAHKDNAQYFYTKYTVLNTRNKFKEAGINLENAIARDGKNAAYAFEASGFYWEQEGNQGKALTYLKKAIELDPKNSDYKRYYGAHLAESGDTRQGIKILEQLAQDDPNNYSVWNDLATWYGYAGFPEKELKTRLTAVKKFPTDAYHWFWLANTYDRQKKKSQAVQAYQKSIALAPDTGAQAAYRVAALTGQKVPEHYREIVEDSIPVLYRNTHAYIRATIAGCTGLFLLDTGATDSILYRSFVKKHAIVIDEDSPTHQYETASGTLSAPVVYADAKIGRFSEQNVQMAVIPSPTLEKDSDGIIGMNILQNFNVKMDNLHGILLFSRK